MQHIPAEEEELESSLRGRGCIGALVIGHSLVWGGVFLKPKAF